MEHGRFDYSPIVDRGALALPERRARRGVGDPQYRAFPLGQALDLGHRGDHASQARRAELLVARFRGAGRHLAHDGGDGAPRGQGHGRAQLGGLRAVSAHNRGRQRARLGVGWGMAAPTRCCSTTSRKRRNAGSSATSSRPSRTAPEPRRKAGSARRSARASNTPDILAENGIEYVCDWVNDEQPYPDERQGGAR